MDALKYILYFFDGCDRRSLNGRLLRDLFDQFYSIMSRILIVLP